MTHDRNGYQISTDSAEVTQGLERFASELLAARPGATDVLGLAAAHPDCALAQAYAAAMWLYSQSRADIAHHATPLLERASALRAGITARESLLIDALLAWARNDLESAIALHERIATDWPRDLVAAKIAEFLFFEAPDYRRHLRFMERIAAANPDEPAFLAMHAFALELCRDDERSESIARRAIELELHTPVGASRARARDAEPAPHRRGHRAARRPGADLGRAHAVAAHAQLVAPRAAPPRQRGRRRPRCASTTRPSPAGSRTRSSSTSMRSRCCGAPSSPATARTTRGRCSRPGSSRARASSRSPS